MFGTRTQRVVAGAIACATIGVSAVAMQAGAATGDDASAFVAVAPCRLFDFRPAPLTVGTRNTPLGANQSHPITVSGNTNGQGNCKGVIPANATALSMNLTAVSPTAATFVSVVPGNQTSRPSTSNINLVAGNAPLANKVDVKLDAANRIRVYNRFGQVHLLGDVVGYYEPTTGGSGTQGLKGDKGDKGLTGAKGDKGDPGAPGADGDDAAVSIQYVTEQILNDGVRTSGTVDCPEGTIAIGGGVSGGINVDVEVSRLEDEAGSGWTVRANTSAGSDMTVTAICATATLVTPVP